MREAAGCFCIRKKTSNYSGKSHPGKGIRIVIGRKRKPKIRGRPSAWGKAKCAHRNLPGACDIRIKDKGCWEDSPHEMRLELDHTGRE